MEWHKFKDKSPDKNGRYLVVTKINSLRFMEVLRFATNLRDVDRYDFPEEDRPGWYDLDSESGYYERSCVTHWTELPEFPGEENAEV